MIIAASGKFGTPGLPVPPPGLTWQDLHKRFKKWFSFHMMTLFAVSIHSLQLPQDRAPTHILLIQIEYHNGSTEVAKHFKLNHTKVITLDEATDMAGPPMQTFREERKDHEGRVILGLLIQCLPMIPGFHVFPITGLSKESISRLPWIPNCPEILEDRFHNGKRF
ncbi:hypothetical protein AGABI2DRAFT_195021 [Agaricus bisporus var. bisporus H97]|nr:hypothetical protein AGABI2DRAFT_195021 [Agaricus bisporus var. bisporus H97]EKV43340.1 hypothetical protein AGABI2DRAFT_195021 [Agaricus bisporus var. bisporus H97]